MNLLLHTIALEPARWTSARVSRPLTELLPAIAAAGFRDLEIYEPHLASDELAPEFKASFEENMLTPVVLSSYLKLNCAERSIDQFEKELDRVVKRMNFYRFRKLRLFPGPSFAPERSTDFKRWSEELLAISRRLPEAEILLETHDGSLADDPPFLTQLIVDLGIPNVGLLYQPTVFEADAALSQFRLQKTLIRHLHLQNRNPDLTFATMPDGVIPWDRIIKEAAPSVDATLEFLPAGICRVEDFDLKETLIQARAEADYVRGLIARRSASSAD